MLRFTCLAFTAGTSLGFGAACFALTINLTFNDPYNVPDDPNDDNEAAKYYDVTGVDRTMELIPVMEAAASIWENIIEDTHTLNITYGWGDLTGLVGNNGWSSPAGSNRPNNGTITFDTRFDGTGNSRPWFFDETPFDDEEYSMTQRLYRDLAASNQSGGNQAWFNGNVPGEFEAWYRGAATDSDAQGAWDALSVAMHELGHALGLPGTDNGIGDGDYDIQPSQVRGAVMGILTDGTAQNDHIRITNANMFAGINAGERKQLSAADVLAAASTTGWTFIDLPRQDYIAAAGNNTWIPANWLGNQNPGTADDAFIRSRTFNPTVELVSLAVARNLFVGEADNVSTNQFKLDIVDTLTVDGAFTDVYADPGGEVEAGTIVVQNTAALSAAGGLVDTNLLTVDGLSSTVNADPGGRIEANEIVLRNQAEMYVYGGIVNSQTMTIEETAFLYGGSGGEVLLQDALVNDGTISAAGGGAFTISGGTWDLDGTGGDGVVAATSANLTFLNGAMASESNGFNGTMTVGANRALSILGNVTLGAGGELQLYGGATASTAASFFGGLVVNNATASIQSRGYGYVLTTATINNGNVNLEPNAILEFTEDVTVAGGSFNLASGSRLRFENDTQLSGGAFATTGTGRVELNGPTTYAGGTIDVVGVVHQDGVATVSARTTIGGAGRWDLDGNGGDTLWNVNDDLTLNVGGLGGTATDVFGGRINLNGSGTTMSINTLAPWTMGGRLDIDDGAGLAGSAEMIVTGAINAESGRIDAPVLFRSGARVTIGPNDVLQLDGPTTFSGGAYQGGTLHQDGSLSVVANTTLGTNLFQAGPVAGQPSTLLWLQQFDWDGSAGPGSLTSIAPGVTFTINAVEIDDDPLDDGYDGTVNINGGTLIVNTGTRTTYPIPPNAAAPPAVNPASWRLDGTMNLQQVSGNNPVVFSEYGSTTVVYGEVNAMNGVSTFANTVVAVDLTGRINVSAGATLNAPLEVSGGASVQVAAGGLFRVQGLSNTKTNFDGNFLIDGTLELDAEIDFYGGSYEGDGLLRQLGDVMLWQLDTRFDVAALFGGNSTNEIEGGLEFQLARGAEVESGARFLGAGLVRNLPGSELTLLDGADVGVHLVNEGTLAVGASPGSAIVRELSQTNDGTLEIEIGGPGAGEFDALWVDTVARLGGTLDVSLTELISGEGITVPAQSDSFAFLKFASLDGQFSNVSFNNRVDTSDGLGSFLLSLGVHHGRPALILSDFLTYTKPGDFDLDGYRDGHDFLVWQRGGSPDPLSASDLADWQWNFGAVVPSSNQAAVPEPCTILLSASGIAITLAFRRRINGLRDSTHNPLRQPEVK